MAEEDPDNDGNTPRRRAAQARRRADEAQLRISELRDRRLGTRSAPDRHHDDLRSALAHAQEAHEQLILALESSALAHERASAHYSEQAHGDPRLEAMARQHLAGAEADWARARELKNP